MVYIIALLFFISLTPFSLQNDERMTGAVGWQVMENLFILPITTFNDIITTDECSMETVVKCFSKAFTESRCISNVYDDRLLSNLNKNDGIINGKMFMNHLKECSISEVKKINYKNITLSRVTHVSGGIDSQYSVYPSCVLTISECFNTEKCIIPSQYNVLEKIIGACSDAAFSKLNLTFVPSIPPLTTYVDDLENLRINKIGRILDSYTSVLSPKIIETFGNLTYEEFDALKMIAATLPNLKQYLCDSNNGEKRLRGNFGFIQGQTSLPSIPQLPENVKDLFKTFSAEIYDSIKAVLKVHPHFRWSFCSPIFAISPSKELTNIFSPITTERTLLNCRILAYANNEYQYSICHKPSLWGC